MALINDIVGRLYLDNDWRDISSLIRADNGISYRRGRQAEDDVTPPQTCTFTLDNNSGDFFERNPLGQYYESLGRSTPFDLALRLAKDTCSTTVSNGWGTTEAHAGGAFSAFTWSTSGGAASDYAKASGKATHAINTAGQNRTTYLSAFAARDVEVSLTVQADVANVAGGSLEQGIAIANILIHGQGAVSTYYMLRIAVRTDESITTDWFSHAGTSLTGVAYTSGLTYAANTPIKVRVQAEGRTLRSKIWLASTSEPYDWTDAWVDEGSDSTTDTMRDVQGWVGVRSSILTGSTNTNITVSYDDIEVKALVFAGEVAEWPQARDVTGSDRTVSVTAAGVRRRLAQGKTLTKSALRSYHEYWPAAFAAKAPSAYWPLEEGTRSVTAAINAVAGNGSSLQFIPPTAGSAVGKIKWAADTERPGSKQSVLLTGGGSLVANISPVTSATAWAVQWQQKFNYTDGAFSTFSTDSASGTAISLTPILSPGTLVLDVGLDAPGVSTSILTHTFTDRNDVEAWHTIALSAEQNGTDVDFFLYVDGAVADSHIQSSMLLKGLKRGQFSSVTNASGDTGFGHIAVYSGDLGTWNFSSANDAAEGHPGEIPVFRASQLADEAGISFDWIGQGGVVNSGDGKPMGARRVATLNELLSDAERVDGGLLYEPRGVVGFEFRTLRSMFSRSSWCTLDLATSKHFSPPWTVTSDDRLLANEVTARREDGGEYTHTLSEGRMSTAAPAEGGIGWYPKSLSFNVDDETDLPDLASWHVARGTIDEERYPGVKVGLHRSEVLGTSGLLSKLRDLDIGDQVTFSGLESTGIYDDRDELVIGYSGYLDLFQHTLTLVTTPASLLRIWTPGSTVAAAAEFARVDSDHTTLDEGLTTTETDVTVAIATGKAFWVNSVSHSNQFPFDVLTGGEVMRVTAGTAPSGQNQTWTVTRSINGVTKTHTTGQKISLAYPNYYGL